MSSAEPEALGLNHPDTLQQYDLIEMSIPTIIESDILHHPERRPVFNAGVSLRMIMYMGLLPACGVRVYADKTWDTIAHRPNRLFLSLQKCQSTVSDLSSKILIPPGD